MPLHFPSDIIDFAPGLRVGVRSMEKCWFGVFTKITETQATVRLEDGTVRRFARESRFEIGSKESRLTRPYLCNHGNTLIAREYYAKRMEEAHAYLSRPGGMLQQELSQ